MCFLRSVSFGGKMRNIFEIHGLSAKIRLISDVNAGINFGRRLLKDCILDNNEDKDWR